MRKKNKLIILKSAALTSLLFSIMSASWLIADSFKNNTYSLIDSNKQLNSTIKSNSVFDYVPVSNNVNAQPVSTSVGFLGTNYANNTLYLTSYEGVTVWEFNAINNSMIKSFYKDILNVDNISGYTIKSWKYLDSIDVIAIILSDVSNSNATVFGIKADTGLIFAPILDSNGNPKPSSNMVTVNDGTNVLWENSAGQVIATVFGDYNTYSNSTYLISFQNGVSKFNASIRNVAVDPDNALSKQTELNKTITIGNKTITYSPKSGWDKGDGSRWYLQALIKGKNNSGTNIAVFSDTTTSINIRASGVSTNYESSFQQAVLVDDSLNPILDASNQKIVLTLTKGLRLGSIWNNLQSLHKYGYTGSSSGSIQNFIWVTSGIWNAVTQIEYNSSTKSLTESRTYDLQWESDQDIYAYSYDITENRLFTSNSFTSSQAAIGYIDFDDQQLSYKKLVAPLRTTNGDIAAQDILKFSPVVSDKSIPETPIIYFNPNDNSKIKGLYFQNNSTTATTVDLLRKTYENIQNKAQSLDWFKKKSTTSVTDAEILNALVYDSKPLNGEFTNSVEQAIGNNVNGTLNVKYKTIYKNWWNYTTNSSFYVETTITGMYETNGSFFNFVTINNGNSENDSKLKLQTQFKESKYPSNVTWQDVSTYFALAKIKNFDGNVINLTQDMITLTPDNEKGTLDIKVDYSSKLPKGLDQNYLIYEHKFMGFNSLVGYDYKLLTDEEQNADENIVNLKKSIYPSELNVSQFLNNFVNLGTSYSKNINDWKFETISNIYDGSLTVNLEYDPKSITLPTDFPESNKKIAHSYKLEGFKNIIDNFKNVATFGYEGIKTAATIWNEYELQKNTGQSTINTTLSKLIAVPHVNFSDLNIQKLDTSTNEKINLLVSVNPGTTSSLIINRTPFSFDDSTKGNFEANGLTYPYEVSINIKTIQQEFAWKRADSTIIDSTNINDDTFYVNLEKGTYPSLNSNMYANDITLNHIFDVFTFQGFILDRTSTSLFADNQNGIVYVTISLISSEQIIDLTNNKKTISLQSTELQNSISDGSNFVKRIEISGFKKPISPIYIAILVSIVGIIIIAVIAVIIYLKVIRKNLKKLVSNKKDNKYVFSLNKKENLKREKIKKNYIKRVKKWKINN